MIQSVQHWPHRHQELCLTEGVDRWFHQGGYLLSQATQDLHCVLFEGSFWNRMIQTETGRLSLFSATTVMGKHSWV